MRTPTHAFMLTALAAVFVAGCGEQQSQESAAPAAAESTPPVDQAGEIPAAVEGEAMTAEPPAEPGT